MNKLIIPGRLPGLNEYIKAMNSSRYAGNDIKHNFTDMVYWMCKQQKIKKQIPVEIVFTWYEANMKRDKDNVAFAKKFILDGLVKAGVLDTDGWKGYGDFYDVFEIDKKNPRVEVELI